MTDTHHMTLSQHWQAHIQTWQSSGLSQMAYCRQHSLVYHQFGYWSRKMNHTQDPTPGFSRVEPLAADAQALIILLPNGIELRGVNANNLPVVSHLLHQLS